MNPYRYLATALRTLLRQEQPLGEQRSAVSFMLRVDFCGTSLTVGKGGHNTVFTVFGDKGKRSVNYPNKVLRVLDQMAKQEHPLYIVCNRGAHPVKSVYHLSKFLKKEPPDVGYSIWSAPDGNCADELYIARHAVSGGKLKWIKAK